IESRRVLQITRLANCTITMDTKKAVEQVYSSILRSWYVLRHSKLYDLVDHISVIVLHLTSLVDIFCVIKGNVLSLYRPLLNDKSKEAYKYHFNNDLTLFFL
ncbi:unnamed protein product, partial [Meganyctiphanes norvegica]